MGGGAYVRNRLPASRCLWTAHAPGCSANVLRADGFFGATPYVLLSRCVSILPQGRERAAQPTAEAGGIRRLREDLMTDLQRRILRLVAKEADKRHDGCASSWAIAHLEWTESGSVEAVSARRVSIIHATLWRLMDKGYVVIADWWPTTVYGWWQLTDAGREALEKEA